MTTKTTQSAATPVHPEPRRALLEGRGYSQHYKDRLSNRFMYFPRWSATPTMGLAASSGFQDRVSSLQILIANARLECNVSHSKQNLLKISNRERIAIFHPRFHPLAQKGRRATSRPPKVQPRLHALYSSFQPRASSLQNLIANPELESRLTYRKLSPLKISNRKYIAISYLDFATGLLTRAVERSFVPAGAFVTRLGREYMRRSRAAQSGQERRAIRAAETRAGVPAAAGGVGSIVSGGDVVKRGFGFRGIQKRIDVPYVRSERLIDEREKARPERRDRARSTDHRLLSVNDDVVASRRVSVARHVGYSASYESVRSFPALFALCWKLGSAKTWLTPPPVAPSFAESSFQACSLLIEAPEIVSFVPPQPTRKGLDAGKSTVGFPIALPSDEPLSPDAASTVTPIVEASWHAELSALRDCAVQESSGPPQLMEIMDGLSVASCTAVVTASMKP